ncbi:LCP family protein [Candidatus Woesebacteria bacterium]|nr:MAG: LCP family protein [Candidatus Woesebacteria bacterium]
MSKMPKTAKASLLIVFFFLASAAVSYTTLGFTNVFSKKNTFQETNNFPSKPIPTPKTESVISVLLLGYGGAGHDGGTLSDVLMLVRLDYASKQVALISIPRDLWVNLPVRSDLSQHFKINMAHAIGLDDSQYGLKQPQYQGELGGGEMAKYAVTTVTGIPVDYFVSVDFAKFSQAIDLLDGIEVEIPVDFDDYFYPIKGLENETCGFSPEEIDKFHVDFSGFDLEKQFTCRYEHLHFEKGTSHMDGQTALKFVRSRHSDQHGGDFARSIRQQAILVATKNKLLALGALNNPMEFVNTIGSIIRTDFDFAGVTDLINVVGNTDEYEINSINLTTDNVFSNTTSEAGAYILIPKEGADKWNPVHAFIANSLNSH